MIACINTQFTFLHTAWSKYWKKSNICISESSKNFQTNNLLPKLKNDINKIS